MKGKFIVDMSSLSNQEYVLALAKMFKAGSDNYSSWSNEIVYQHQDTDNPLNWYRVGRNATHEFFLAVDSQDNLWRRSYSVNMDVDTDLMTVEEYNRLMQSDKLEDWDLATKAEKFVEEKNISQVTRNNIGYIGHW